MAIPIRDGHPTRRFPWVTVALVAINVVVFLFVQPAGFQSGADGRSVDQSAIWLAADAERFSYRWGAVACEITTGELVSAQPDGCEATPSPFLPAEKSILLSLLTCMFLHGSILHLAGNLLFLWVFGNNVEDRLGSSTFLLLYLVGGVLATLGFVAFNAQAAVPLIGASGAIAAAMGAYLVLFPRARILTVIFTAAFQVVYVPAAVVLLLYFVTQVVAGSSPVDDTIAWEAHAAGMVVGALAGLALARVPAVRARATEHEADEALRTGASF